MDGKYSISRDEENFHGTFDSEQEAIEEAIVSYGGRDFYVGKVVRPIQPESYWHAEDWLEHVSCQDDYNGEWAEDWDNSTKAEREELEQEVRHVMANWLDRHGNRPTHFNIGESRRFTVVDGVAKPA